MRRAVVLCLTFALALALMANPADAKKHHKPKSKVSTDIGAAHGIVTVTCTGDIAHFTTVVSVLDSHDGHIVARRSFVAPTNATTDHNAASAVYLALCVRSSRNSLDSLYQRVVALAGPADGSAHAAFWDLKSGKLIDLRMGAAPGGLAPLLHDSNPMFGPRGRIFFSEWDGAKGQVLSVDPSTRALNVVLGDYPDAEQGTPPTITAKGDVLIPQDASICIGCNPIPNTDGSASVQNRNDGFEVFLPPEWRKQLIPVTQDIGGQRFDPSARLEPPQSGAIAWLDATRLVCVCLNAPAGGTTLGLATFSADFTNVTVTALFGNTDRASDTPVPSPDASTIAFASIGHGEDALYTVPTGGGDPKKLLVLQADPAGQSNTRLLEWR
jgi:hypothetical protein